MKVIHKTFGIQKADSGYVEGYISGEDTDRDGDQVVQAGIDCSKASVLLNQHNHAQPIGKLEAIERRPQGLWARFKFASNKLAQEARQMVAEGVLTSFSIGFMVLESEPIKTGFRFLKTELLETSLVSVPSQSAALVTAVKSFKEKTMQTQNAPIGELKTVPGVVAGDGHEYNLISVLQKMAQGHPILGFEAEVSEELAKSCEGIADGPGIIVPEAMLRGGRIMDKRRVAHLKAAGALTGNNLEPLTGIGHHDELYRYVDGAITRQDVYSTIGATEITCVEATCRIPVMDTPATATHVGVDDPLADSADLGFRNVDIVPVKLGTVMEVLLSAMLSQHPQMYINQVLAELNRALNQEKARALIYGVKATDKIDGLLALATASGVTSVPVDATSKAKIFEIQQELESYFQGTYSGRWLLHPGFIDGLKTVPSFTGSSFQALLDDNAGVLGNHPLVRSVGLTVAGSTGSKTADGLLIGDPSAVVHPVWMGVRLDVNPWADSVYKKGSAILRAHMLHGFALSDPKAVLKFKTTIPG